MVGFTLKDLAKKYKAINKKKGYRGWYEATKGSKPSQGAIEVKNAGNVLYNNAFFNQAMGSIDSSTNISGVGTADGGIGMVSSAPAGGGAMGESLNKHITLEEIKNIISTTFKIVSHPVKGQSYILPNGEFIELKDNAHNEIDFLLMDYDLIKDPEYYDSFEDLTLVNDFNSVRIGDGKIINHSPYIILPKNKLTSAQYSSLEDWIWSLEDKNIFIGSSKDNKDYSLEEYIPEEIIDKIKRYYSSGTLYESKIRKFFLNRLNESSDNNLFPTFIEEPEFKQAWKNLGLEDKELSELQHQIKDQRNAWIPLGSEVYKFRFSPQNLTKGKREAFRIIFFVYLKDGSIDLYYIFTKAQESNIKNSTLNIIREIANKLNRG